MKTLQLLPLMAALAACAAPQGGNTASGTVSGYGHAKVCIDVNSNGRCDAGEPSGFSDGRGAFTLSGAGPLVAEIGGDATRLDSASKASIPVRQPLVFRAPAGAAVLSGISTELVAMTEDKGGDQAAARASLAARLGLSEDQLLADPGRGSDPAVKAKLQAENERSLTRIAEAVAEAGTSGDMRRALRNRLALDRIETIVVIYAENRGFDNLYGLFPGANGVPGVNPSSTGSAAPQKDFDGSTLPTLPPVWGGLTAAGQSVAVTQAQTVGWPNRPFRIDDPAGINGNTGGTGVVLNLNVTTRDLVHRYYNNQMQINGGANDKFAAYSDAGALTMGYYDGSAMAMWEIARRYTLADNFFMGAFGGSFLNHQYLICACAPEYPNADTSPAKNSISAIDVDAQGNFLRLTPAADAAKSVLAGPPTYLRDGNLTPRDASGRYHAVNTMQPPYQPGAMPPAADDATKLYADPSKPTTLPPQTARTIGDLLSDKGLAWAWYAGAWNAALADGATGNHRVIYAGAAQFQPHHQPFNYYKRFDPVSGAAERQAHLKDYDGSFLQDAAAGRLPSVSFYKPQGRLNQHPGYANVADGDAHVAELVAKLQASPQWPHMLIVVTYDENGGFYDHAQVPKGDRWGPGTRIPAIIVSPYAKRAYVDKTQYDTGSVLRFISHRFSLPTLPGLAERDAALAAHGFKPMGDLTGALDLGNLKETPGRP